MVEIPLNPPWKGGLPDLILSPPFQGGLGGFRSRTTPPTPDWLAAGVDLHPLEQSGDGRNPPKSPLERGTSGSDS